MTAAMFQVAVFSLLSSSATFHRGPMHMVNRSLAEYCDDVLPMFVGALLWTETQTFPRMVTPCFSLK